jgi:hypothetical protein
MPPADDDSHKTITNHKLRHEAFGNVGILLRLDAAAGEPSPDEGDLVRKNNDNTHLNQTIVEGEVSGDDQTGEERRGLGPWRCSSGITSR